MISELARKLKKFQQNGNKAIACCPCHDDKNPSLSITEENGKILVNCFAGCDPKNILKTLGLYQEKKDLTFVSIPNETHPYLHIANLSKKVWFYKNDKGEILFFIERVDFKDGKKISPYTCYQDDQGQYIYQNNLGGLVSLPLLNIEKINSHRNIIIVEGEKTCDATNQYIEKQSLDNFIAITWAFGSQSIDKTNFSHLKDKNIYLLPDNDTPGKKAMKSIGNKLNASNKIKWIKEYPNKPEGYDIADENDDFDLKSLLSRSVNFPKKEDLTRSISAVDLMNKSFPPINYLVKDYIAEGFTMFIGRPKVGKSWFLLQLAYHIASGLPFFEKNTIQGDVLYLSLEDGQQRLNSRLKILNYSKIPSNLHFVFQCPKFDSQQKGTEILLRELEKLKNPKLIIIDTVQKILSQNVRGSNTSYEKQYEQYGFIKDFAHEHGISIIGSGHQKKKKDEEEIYDTVNGSMAIQGSSDQMIIFTNNEKRKELYRLQTIGRDIIEQDITISKNSQTMQFHCEGTTEILEEGERRSAIRKTLEEEDKAMMPSEIDKILNGKSTPRETNNINKCLQRMTFDDITIKESYGKYKMNPNPGMKQPVEPF